MRADAVLTAPEDGVPVMSVEVDNHTEPAAVVARKIENYRRFWARFSTSLNVNRLNMETRTCAPRGGMP
ncbi:MULTISPECIES: replication-relaxation family protein [Streptomyces]|uniref:replication-relaxation family protein n=1 Tax=Streptomyces TaxID=1883 RepID=UPI002380DC26|nr:MULTISPECIES: replication-relaxation family protein [unclassified Streptomyces]MDX2744619.1 replication-relaxation family protein [Streptomyces sp. NRRL_B-2557]MDX3063546.1 replication-relaxation family protein [Streptomyces sp. ND04-05B]WRY86925.1 replication-relaxation family protein [Streptomyces clavifer]